MAPRRYVVNAFKAEQAQRLGPFGCTKAQQVADALRWQGWRATLQLVSTHPRQREEATR